MRRSISSSPRRGGFTLVEMLVSVALMLVLMSMFAQVFGIAANTVSKQRAIMHNDQKARTVQTIITKDLRARTFRYVYPFTSTEDLTAPEAFLDRRQGYFYISENNPVNTTDDIIQFTASYEELTDDTGVQQQPVFYGKTTQIGGASVAYTPYRDQPEADDGVSSANSQGTSASAEIALFMRRGGDGRPGALYRRVLLIRDQGGTGPDHQPGVAGSNGSFTPFFNPDTSVGDNSVPRYTPGSSTFWNDFDYSAVFTGNSSGASFNSSTSLLPGTSLSIGLPWRRFGFRDLISTGSSDLPGQPKEYLASGDFIGRYLMEETSHQSFGYPQTLTSSNINPMSTTDGGLSLDTTQNVVTAFQHNPAVGSRRGEDLLLSNVHCCDVKVWDDGAGAFVDLGGTSLSTYANGAKLNNYGNSQWSNIYDTWFSSNTVVRDVNGDSVNDPPPYRPTYYNSSALSRWSAGASASVGSLMYPTSGTQADDPFYYRAVAVQGSATTGTTQPSWPRYDGGRVWDGDAAQVNGVVWQAFDNRIPLKAIQISIRYVDPGSGSVRNLTIVENLTTFK